MAFKAPEFARTRVDPSVGKLGGKYLEFLLNPKIVGMMSAVLTRQVTSKGQITIPQDLRDELGLAAGDRVDFIRSPEGDVVVRKSLPREDFFGLMDDYSNPEKSVALDELDPALRAAAGKEFKK